MSKSAIAALPEAEQLAFIRAVLAINEEWPVDNTEAWEAIWWRTDNEYAPVTFFVNCNDLFYWACADCEQLTPENLPKLLDACVDCRKAMGCESYGSGIDINWTKFERFYDAASWAPLLLVARVRGMRPQRPYYKSIPEDLHALFDACGPERDRKDEG